VNARWLVVHLPAFRLERCGFSAEDIAGLVAEERNALRVVAATPAAWAEGIKPGVTAAEARALVPGIELLPLDPDGEAADRAELLRACGRLSDRTATHGADDLLLEISRTTHLFGGEAGAVEAAVALAASFGHETRAALADDPIGAAAVARYGLHPGEPWRIVPRGALAAHLAELPLVALGPSPVVHDALRAVGIRRIGELAALDAASVAGRWGEEAARLVRLARGEPTSHPAAPPVDDRPIVVSAPLAGATAFQEIAFALPGTLGQLLAELAARDLAVVQLRVVLRLERGGMVAVPVRSGRPTRDPVRLTRLVHSRLEPVRLPSPVTELVLEVAETAPALGWQPGLVDRTEATEPLPELLARLADALGEAALFAPGLADRWRPETSWEPRPFPVARQALVAPSSSSFRLVDDPVEAQAQWVRLASPRPRPLLLLTTPKRLDVRTGPGGGVPVSARLGDDWIAVTRVEGPERLQGEWWRIDDPLDREYWVARVGSATAWLYRHQVIWYLHGWFD